jgi:hypothetical protein
LIFYIFAQENRKAAAKTYILAIGNGDKRENHTDADERGG